VELYEQIRREYEHGGGTIRGIAKKLGIHRRMVREAVLSARGLRSIQKARFARGRHGVASKSSP
jgi:ActR/RegA family two-component response regulator